MDDERDRNEPRVTPEMRLEFEQAIKDAGLEDTPSVSGRYVHGKGWDVEDGNRVAFGPGWTRYAP